MVDLLLAIFMPLRNTSPGMGKLRNHRRQTLVSSLPTVSAGREMLSEPAAQEKDVDVSELVWRELVR